jgi:DNA-binding FadR family transcriptional regulator
MVERVEQSSRKMGESIAASIRRQIAVGELAVGDRLPNEDELTEQYGIARTTQRQALRILESQGLISIRRGRGGGATVTMPDLARLAEPLAVVLRLRRTTTTDLDAARLLIEPQLAGSLAERRTEEDLAALRAAIEVAEAAAEAGDRGRFGEAAAALHTLISERGGNETLSVISQVLHRLVLDRYTTGARRSDTPLMMRAVRSYRRLYTLIEERDAEGAATHWERQMRWTTTVGGEDLLDPFEDTPVVVSDTLQVEALQVGGSGGSARAGRSRQPERRRARKSESE